MRPITCLLLLIAIGCNQQGQTDPKNPKKEPSIPKVASNQLSKEHLPGLNPFNFEESCRFLFDQIADRENDRDNELLYKEKAKSLLALCESLKGKSVQWDLTVAGVVETGTLYKGGYVRLAPVARSRGDATYTGQVSQILQPADKAKLLRKGDLWKVKGHIRSIHISSDLEQMTHAVRFDIEIDEPKTK